MIVNSMVCLCIGIFIGFWTKNQVNESKNPVKTIWSSLCIAGKWFREQYRYCMKKIPDIRKRDSV